MQTVEDELTYVVDRQQCPKCADSGKDSSGDNLAVYNDGHSHCFACSHHVKGDGTKVITSPKNEVSGEWKPYQGSFSDLSSRQINVKTCRLYGYKQAVVGDQSFDFWNCYNDEGQLVAQKLRGENKKFKWHGNSRNPQLFGQHLYKIGGRRLIITEGEIDAMTVSQLMENKWPVVSLPNGAASALRDIKNNLTFVSSYKEVVLLFDNDAAGREAAAAVADILPPGNCKIGRLMLKDANEHLLAAETSSLMTAVFEAQVYTPDEIVHVSNIMADSKSFDRKVWAFPWEGLTNFCVGQRSGEITLWSSGTGSGKSTIIRELILGHIDEGRTVGAIMLEESPQETIDDLISLMLNKPVRAIKSQEMLNTLREDMGLQAVPLENLGTVTNEEYNDAKAELGEKGLYIYDHEGHNAMQNLMTRMEYMAISLGVDVIVLDHITAAATAMLMVEEGMSDERLLIDKLMKGMRSLVARTGVHIDVVSQLKKTDKAYEEGSRITLQDLRGSGSLGSVANTVIGLERNRQMPDELEANTTTVRILKDRLTGRAGVASYLYYDRKLSRLKEIDEPSSDSFTDVTKKN